MKYTLIISALLASTSAIKLEQEFSSSSRNPKKPDYYPFEDGFEGHWSYNRVSPDHFDGAGSGDDQFMNSMIMNYAMESATKDGTPTGQFYFNHITAFTAAAEILKTHLGLEGKAADDYLDQYFEKTWDHFNTADDGKIEVARMGSFFRFLCANMQINLH